MKKTVFLSMILLALFIFTCSGCLFIPNSPMPKFYTIHATGSPGESGQLEINPKLIIAVGPVGIPEYQNRPQIVTRDQGGMLRFAQFNRWGEPMDEGIERLILENLAGVFPQVQFQMFPCDFSIPLDYQVLVNVIDLESRLDKDVVLTAQWTIINSKTKTMLLTKRSEIRQAVDPHTYEGLVDAISRATTLLSVEIAENLSRLLK
jgi:hypothetical protein